jgi:hypothetical protein
VKYAEVSGGELATDEAPFYFKLTMAQKRAAAFLHVRALRERSDLTGRQKRVVRAGDFKGNLGDFLREYNYQSDLTKRLDDLAELTLTPELINEIVLWKVNRFVWLEEGLLDRLDKLKTLEAGAHRQAHSVVELLLAVHGIDLRWLQPSCGFVTRRSSRL